MDASFALIVTAAGSAVAWQARRWQLSRRAPGCRKRQSLLKPAQRYIYSRLQEAVGEQFSIQASVPVSRVIVTEKPARRRGSSRQGVTVPEIDFLLCEPATLEPRMVILCSPEATSESRTRSDKESQRLVRKMKSAGLAALMLEPDREYDAETLQEEIEAEIGE